jgi:hypothetical protein
MEGIGVVNKEFIHIDVSVFRPITTWEDCIECHKTNGHFNLIKEKDILSDEDYLSIQKCYKKEGKVE